jgi:signal transduction histidine kinase
MPSVVGVKDRRLARRTLVDWGPTVVLLGVAAHELAYNQSPGWQWVTALGAVLALVLRTRFPVPVLAVTVTLAAIDWSSDVLLIAHLSVLVALHAVAWRRPRQETWCAATLVLVAAVWVGFRFSPTGSANDGIVVLCGLTLATVLLGTTQRAQQESLHELADRAEELRRERNRSVAMAAAEERTRIAREVHDIVAHSVSVMIALSEGAARTPDETASRESMRQVAVTGRQALSELRKVLSVLRASEDADPRVVPGVVGEAQRAPQPSLDGLGRLLEDFEMAGLRVDLEISGDPSGMSPGLQATAFRIVQECLTNTLKHAVDPRRSRVLLQILDDQVVVEVSDDGRAGDPERATTVPGGNGIRGIRERGRMYDAELVVGPGTGAGGRPGWVVRCVLAREGVDALDQRAAR